MSVSVEAPVSFPEYVVDGPVCAVMDQINLGLVPRTWEEQPFVVAALKVLELEEQAERAEAAELTAEAEQRRVDAVTLRDRLRAEQSRLQLHVAEFLDLCLSGHSSGEDAAKARIQRPDLIRMRCKALPRIVEKTVGRKALIGDVVGATLEYPSGTDVHRVLGAMQEWFGLPELVNGRRTITATGNKNSAPDYLRIPKIRLWFMWLGEPTLVEVQVATPEMLEGARKTEANYHKKRELAARQVAGRALVGASA